MPEEITSPVERPALDSLSRAGLRARAAANEARVEELRSLGSNMTAAQVREVNSLLAETTQATGLVAEIDAALAPAPAPVVEVPVVAEVAPVEVPVVTVVSEPLPEPTADEVAAVISAADAMTAPALVTAAASGLFRMSESDPVVQSAEAHRARFHTASVSGGRTEIGDELTMAEIGKLVLDEASARLNGQGTGAYIKLASAPTLVAEEWPFQPVSATSGLDNNERAIAEAKRRHKGMRIASADAGIKTAAPLGAMVYPLGTAAAFRDVPNAYATSNGIEVLNRIAMVPSAVDRAACYIEHQLPHTKAQLAGASRVWTNADQGAVDPLDPSTWKPVVVPPTVLRKSLIAAAVPVGYTPERCYTTTNPEAVANDLHILSSIVNDVKVSYTLGRFDAVAKNLELDAINGYGAFVELRGMLHAIDGYIGSLGLAAEYTDYAIIVDSGLIDLLGYDDDASGFNADKGGIMSKGELRAELSRFGEVIEVSQTEIGRPSPWADFGLALPASPENGGLVSPFPKSPMTFKVRVIDFAGWFRLEPPGVEFGLKDDYDHLRQNRLPYFGESFISAGWNGVSEQFSIECTFSFDGVRQSTRDLRGSTPLFF